MIWVMGKRLSYKLSTMKTETTSSPTRMWIMQSRRVLIPATGVTFWSIVTMVTMTFSLKSSESMPRKGSLFRKFFLLLVIWCYLVCIMFVSSLEILFQLWICCARLPWICPGCGSLPRPQQTLDVKPVDSQHFTNQKSRAKQEPKSCLFNGLPIRMGIGHFRWLKHPRTIGGAAKLNMFPSCCLVRFRTYSAKVAVALVVLLFVLCVKMGWIGPPSLKEDDLVALKTFNDTYRTLAREVVNSVSLCLFRNPTSCAKDLTGVLCVCITVCLICALVQKAACFSKIHMFGAIAVVAASRDVNNFRKTAKISFSWRILYGGRWFNMVICSFGTEIIVTCLCFSLERRLHSFAISKKDWGMVQLELEEDVTLACICRN